MAELELIIGNKNYSSWSLRPWILMRYFDIAFKERRVPLYTDASDAELKPYFSNSKVPVLVDDGFIVWDSLSIMEYVSEKYLSGKGWPQDLRARAYARSMCAEMHSSFTSLRNELPMNCRERFPDSALSTEAQQDITRIKKLWQQCMERYAQSSVNGAGWLCGEYSIADAMFAPVVMRFVGYGVALNPAESAYAEATLALPAMQEWIKAGKAEKEVIDFG